MGSAPWANERMSQQSFSARIIHVSFLSDLLRGLLNIASTTLLVIASRRNNLEWWSRDTTKFVLGGAIAACCVCFVRMLVACLSTVHNFRFGSSLLLFSGLEIGFLTVVLVFVVQEHTPILHSFQRPTEFPVCSVMVDIQSSPISWVAN